MRAPIVNLSGTSQRQNHESFQISASCQNLSGYRCSVAGSYVRAAVWRDSAQWHPSGEVELIAACCWNPRSSLDPAARRYVKAAFSRSLVREELWRHLPVRRIAWAVPGRRRQQRAGAERSWLREAATCSCVELSGQASENDIRHSDGLFGRRRSSLCHSLSHLLPLLRRCALAGTSPAKVSEQKGASQGKSGSKAFCKLVLLSGSPRLITETCITAHCLRKAQN